MDVFEIVFNNWAILTIIVVILAIIIAFNEIRISNTNWNYQLHRTVHFKEHDTKSFYANYFHWYSSFNNDPFQIIINIHDKFIDCLEAEYQSTDTDIGYGRKLIQADQTSYYLSQASDPELDPDLEYGRRLIKTDHMAYYLSQISDPELKFFVQSPARWLEQHLHGKNIHFYEKDKDPELIKIEIASLVPVFHDIITRIFTFLKLPQDKDWINFYDLIDKRKLEYRNKKLKILSFQLSIDVVIIVLFYISVSFLTSQIAPIFIIILPIFFLGFFQPLLWKKIRHKFFETTNDIFAISNKEGL